jgi:hypothetical protein
VTAPQRPAVGASRLAAAPIEANNQPPAASRQSPNVAIVHDWLTGMRGGEKVLEAICDLYPEASLYTLVQVRGSVSPRIERHRIKRSPVQGCLGQARRTAITFLCFPLPSSSSISMVTILSSAAATAR